MSLLFADIFEAIRYLRLCKGTTEKGILGYVEDRVGGCLSTGHVSQSAFLSDKRDNASDVNDWKII